MKFTAQKNHFVVNPPKNHLYTHLYRIKLLEIGFTISMSKGFYIITNSGICITFFGTLILKNKYFNLLISYSPIQ